MDNITDLQIGIAGEYLVCADLILNGYVAFQSEQGLPFDVVLSHQNKLLKIQVKTTRKYKRTPQRITDIPVYIFHIGNNGKMNRRKRYSKNDVDIFALVALDTKTISYIPFFDIQTTMIFRVPEFRGKYHDEKSNQIKNAVVELRDSGKTIDEICEILKLTKSNAYKYTSNMSLVQRGTNAGTYFDTLTLDKCLSEYALNDET